MRSPIAAPPVGSPLRRYGWRGRSSLPIQDAAPSRSSAQTFARGGRRDPLRKTSRDLLLLSLLLAAAPLHAHSTDAPINLTLTLTGTTVIAIGLALVIGAAAGMILGGVWHAAMLRDADDTVTSHRARTIARLFAASAGIHATVDEMVRDAHARITTLQTTLTRIRTKEHRDDH